MTDEEMDKVWERARRRFESHDEDSQERIMRSESSFGDWLMGAIRSIGEQLGYIISYPFKAVKNFITSFFGGIFK